MKIDIPTSEYIDEETLEKHLISEMLRANGLTLTKAIKKHNEINPENQFTNQNISNKINRNSLKLHDFAALAEACGFQLTLINNNDRFVPIRPRNGEIKVGIINSNSFNQLVDQGYCEAKSINFQSAIIAGQKCNEAAEWLENQLTDDLTVAGEIKLYIDCKQLFGVMVKPLAATTIE